MKKIKTKEVKVLGRSLDELKLMSSSTLGMLAKLLQQKNGKEVYCKQFHFLKKNEQIKMLLIGDNENPIS